MLDSGPGELRREPLGDGSTRLDLVVDDRTLSHVYIIPLTVAVGAARVRVDGIGGVWTDEAHRRRGYARRCMEAAVRQMREGDAALSVLFGIRYFYEQFGFVPAGPETALYLTELETSPPVPNGRLVRRCELRDLPAVQALYAAYTAHSVGAVARSPEGQVWTKLRTACADPARDECRVVEAPDGAVLGYAWRGTDFWSVDTEEETPDALTIGEAVACAPKAADVLLAACRAWAVEAMVRRPEITRAKLHVAPEGPVYAAATRQHSRLELLWLWSGGFCARTLDTQRLLTALEPELTRRVRSAAAGPWGTIHMLTDLGDVALEVSADGVKVLPPGEPRSGAKALGEVQLAQQDLTRLALGTFPPGDVLERLSTPPDSDARRWLELLFAQRLPYMHPHDWI
ncbi:MAG: GNAT family N-acetyltransferase [Chloroflexota bacterium]|nr:GNAT family N-acetyltransferase [Chloroflexota bacterium]